jgi:hypothetical protein
MDELGFGYETGGGHVVRASERGLALHARALELLGERGASGDYSSDEYVRAFERAEREPAPRVPELSDAQRDLLARREVENAEFRTRAEARAAIDRALDSRAAAAAEPVSEAHAARAVQAGVERQLHARAVRILADQGIELTHTAEQYRAAIAQAERDLGLEYGRAV